MLVRPCEIAVIQRGIKFSVDFPTQTDGSEMKTAEDQMWVALRALDVVM